MSMIWKSIIAIIITVVAGYLVYPLVAASAGDEAVVFTLGLVIGSLIQAALLLGLQLYKPKRVPGSVYVGNLSYSVTEEDVRQLFEKQGQVYSVRLMRDRATGKMRGFGFVEMNIEDAERVITTMNGLEFAGRKLKVNSANEKKNYS